MSSAADYLRFTRMLLGGGELDGVRLLSPRTLRLMTSNHLPGHADLEAFGRPLFAETTFDGVGFGLGFSVVEDPVAGRYPSSRGEFAWGGAASTAFWVDPAERMRCCSSPSCCRRAPTRSAPSCTSSSTRRWSTSHQRGADPLEPLRAGAPEAVDPLELLEDALRAPVDGEHVERGGEHQRVVVEHRPQHARDAPELGIVGLRQPRCAARRSGGSAARRAGPARRAARGG